jgi:hypothetical protein
LNAVGGVAASGRLAGMERMSRRAVPAGADRYRRIALSIALALLALAWSGPAASGYSFDGPEGRQAGNEQTVFDWTNQACEATDIPDNPARAFRDVQGGVQLIASHYVTRRMIGTTLENAQHQCPVVMTSDGSTDPSKYNDKQWIGATYTHDGRTIYALLHTEFQGWRYDPGCGTVWVDQQKCWMNSIGLGTSTNAGASYSHAAAPGHLVAAAPYTYGRGTGPFGIFNPSNIVHRPADGYYYTLFWTNEIRAQKLGACVMRTNNLADPTSWRAWDGSGFNVSFINPYVQTSEQPSAHVCEPIAPDQVNRMTGSLTYSTYFGKFLLVGTLAPKYGPPGIYYTTSDDLVHWDERKLLMSSELVLSFQCGDEAPLGNPSVIDPDSQTRNFETVGQTAYLYLTRYNPSWYGANCFLELDRDLIRIPISFSGQSTPPPTGGGAAPTSAPPTSTGSGVAAVNPSPSKACVSATRYRKILASRLKSARRKLQRTHGRKARRRQAKRVRQLQLDLRRWTKRVDEKCRPAKPATLAP